ncbi:hypothetical protein BC941DRAFT_504951 [Chlamydoabsidia padenii]|nr:hypothetical protein BC941DRAFT_504951 [Chlamydoabsidia padenii]
MMADNVDQVNPSPSLNITEDLKQREGNKQKILDIIDHQFDLEIYLKYREVATIQKEIENAESTLQDLELAIKNETLAATLPDLPHFTRQSAAALYYGHGVPTSSTLSTSTGSSMKRKATKPTSLGAKQTLYGRRIDGVYVRLGCPVCHRDNFSTQLGLLNHCRISHSLEFGFYENIMAQCGTPVDESEVPEDHPIRTRPLALPVVPATPAKKIERPTIKEYEEDVDLELDQSGSTAKRMKTESIPTDQVQKVLDNDMKNTNNEPATVTASEQPSPDARQTNLSPTTSTMDTFSLEDNISAPFNQNISNSSPSTGATDILSPQVSTPTSSQPNDPNHSTPQAPLESYAEKTPTTSNTTSINVPSSSSATPLTPVSEIPDDDNNTKTESLTSAIAEKGSRFYIKRRIVVGNVSKYIPPDKRDPTLKNYTHKWMIYVVEPHQEKDKAQLLTGVRYHLHPSYKPYDVVDVTESPFRLTRLGWGEFPIRLQLYFVDKRRNKSLDIIHHLKLDYTLSGRQRLGSERGFDIELDRNTNFDDVTSIPATLTDPTTPPVTTPSSPQSMLLTPNIPSQGQQHISFNAGKQRLTLLQGILKESVQQFPIVLRAGSQLQSPLPYTCAQDNQQYLTWPSPKRKALEWYRSHLLRRHVQQWCRDTKDEVLLSASDTLGTKEVIHWCRAQGYTPLNNDNSSETSKILDNNDKEENSRIWCRYCGSAMHTDCPSKPTGWKQKRAVLGDQHTLSDVQTLLTSLGLDLEQQQSKKREDRREKRTKEEDDEELDVDVDIQHDSTTSATHHHLTCTPAPSHLPATAIGTTRTSTILHQHQELLDYLKESASELTTGDERTLDWMWSVIAQLRLKGMIGNELSLSRQSGQLHFQRPNVPSVMDLTTAMDQRLVVGQLFVQITKLFIKKLLAGGVEIWKKERRDDETMKLLVPYHIHQAAKRIPNMDFLTNAYMGTKADKSATTEDTSHNPSNSSLSLE